MKQKLRNLLNKGKLVIGYERVIKMLSHEEDLLEIVLANNTPKDFVDEIKRKAELASVKIEQAEVNNEELGVLCKKPFNISVLGIKK